MRSAFTRRPGEATVAWVAARRDLLQLGGIAAGIVVLRLVDLSWLGLLVLAIVIGGYELAVARIAGLTPSAVEPEQRTAVETP